MFSAFKYYIHDTANGYLLEMSGPLTETNVIELNCCWRTAKTTLGSRGLKLDVARVTSIDEPARQWLAAMVQDGAKCIPDSFLLDTVARLTRNEMPALEGSTKPSFFGRLFRFAPKPIP